MRIDKQTLESILTKLLAEKIGFVPAPQLLQLFTHHAEATDHELWSGSNLNFWKISKLINSGWWNNHRPPLNAHKLLKPSNQAGAVLIDHRSLRRYIEIQCLASVLWQGRQKLTVLLRHSYNSHLAIAIVDQATQMTRMREISVIVNRDYTHIELARLSRAVGMLESPPQRWAPKHRQTLF